MPLRGHTGHEMHPRGFTASEKSSLKKQTRPSSLKCLVSLDSAWVWLSSTGKKWISVFVPIRSVFANSVTYDWYVLWHVRSRDQEDCWWTRRGPWLLVMIWYLLMESPLAQGRWVKANTVQTGQWVVVITDIWYGTWDHVTRKILDGLLEARGCLWWSDTFLWSYQWYKEGEWRLTQSKLATG